MEEWAVDLHIYMELSFLTIVLFAGRAIAEGLCASMMPKVVT